MPTDGRRPPAAWRAGARAAAAALLCLAASLAGARAGELDDGSTDAHPAGTSLPDGVRLLRDLAYGADPRQRYDVYLPATAAQPAAPAAAPVLFMVHGGAWRLGDKAMANVVAHKVAHWLPQGWVLVSVNYRMLPDTPVAQQADDIAHALADAQSHAAEWGADRRQFVLMGHSAGAHLVAWLAADPPTPWRAATTPWRGAVLLDSAVYDVAELMAWPHFGLYDDAFGKEPSRWAGVSPIAQLSHAVPPMLAVCSTRRRMSCRQAEAFVDRAIERAGRATVLRIDRSHGEINADLGDASDYTAQVDRFMASVRLAR